ncbi:MAG: dihydrouridine synthase family protein [Candidatus Magnetoglobus multicellularis str. Araruama]|uniref:tRNA-dihydrouridine synthase n=1 Tax=Candidatus Magnetoglobus multicellularis str. Araruama TaxID=890399 RepID=A0A1V1P7T2_9BACT|nr:MAG: dihydrouridine synthase family protein [Candidatus Magnetoglobus multicellularis str. Araruama]
MQELQSQDLKHHLSQPLRIGTRTLTNRLVFAPMSGLGHVAFRELLAEYGHYGLLFSEMSSAKAIPHENRQVSLNFRWRDAERHSMVWQILGNSPNDMAKAARRIAKEGFFGVDINFSCSVARICKRGMGAFLLKKPDLAIDIVKAVRDAVDIPLWVKFRTGWLDKDKRIQLEPSGLLNQAIDFAGKLSEAGTDAITFHPRVAPDRRTRPPKWSHIAKIKQAVSIPVFGNGNVFDASDCHEMFDKTACDGISLGRIALAKPWIFAELNGVFQANDNTYKEAILTFIHLLEKHYDQHHALKRFYKFSRYYCSSFRFGNNLRANIRKSTTFEEIKEVLTHFFESPVMLNQRLNENLIV